jgi:hypothetical protein
MARRPSGMEERSNVAVLNKIEVDVVARSY